MLARLNIFYLDNNKITLQRKKMKAINVRVIADFRKGVLNKSRTLKIVFKSLEDLRLIINDL